MASSPKSKRIAAGALLLGGLASLVTFAIYSRGKLGREAAPPPSETYRALVTRSFSADPQALAEALKHVHDPSQVIREAAAVALGHYPNPDALEALRGLLKDPEPQVRARALDSLGSLPPEMSRATLLSFSQDSASLSAEERQSLELALIRTASAPMEKESNIEKFLAAASALADPEQQSLAFTRLMQQEPGDPRLLEALRKRLRDPSSRAQNRAIAMNAIQHLATQRDPWLAQQAAALLQDPDAGIRQAVLSQFHVICPEERWPLLRASFAAEREAALKRQWIEAASFMAGEEARSFLQSVLTREPALAETAQAALAKLSRPGAIDHCAGPAPQGTPAEYHGK